MATKSPADLVSSEVPGDFFIFINLARPRASVVASVLSTTALLCGVASGVLAMALMTLHSLWSGGGSTVGEEVGLEVFGEVLEGEGGQSRAVKLDHHLEVPAFLKNNREDLLQIYV